MPYQNPSKLSIRKETREKLESIKDSEETWDEFMNLLYRLVVKLESVD